MVGVVKSHARNSKAESVGRRIGNVWQAFRRQELRATRWMVSKGASPLSAKWFLLIVELAAAAVLLYIAFWLVLVLAFVALAAVAAQRTYQQPSHEEWLTSRDHRDEPFYHPVFCNDERDPRFNDPRFKDE